MRGNQRQQASAVEITQIPPISQQQLMYRETVTGNFLFLALFSVHHTPLKSVNLFNFYSVIIITL